MRWHVFWEGECIASELVVHFRGCNGRVQVSKSWLFTFPQRYSTTPLDGGVHLPNNLNVSWRIFTEHKCSSEIAKVRQMLPHERSQDRKMLAAFSFPLQPISCITSIGAKHFLSHQQFILPVLDINSVSWLKAVDGHIQRKGESADWDTYAKRTKPKRERYNRQFLDKSSSFTCIWSLFVTTVLIGYSLPYRFSKGFTPSLAHGVIWILSKATGNTSI